jgi:hypothetical protein
MFKVAEAKRRRLDAATQAWLALGFGDQDFYLLVPWSVAQTVARPSDRDARLWVNVHVDGRGRVVGALAEFVHRLEDAGDLRDDGRLAA